LKNWFVPGSLIIHQTEQRYKFQERQASRSDENDDDEESDTQAQAAQEMLELLKEDKDQNNGRLSDQYIIQFYKEKLLSMPCQNQVTLG